jgi:hypothetical protein
MGEDFKIDNTEQAYMEDRFLKRAINPGQNFLEIVVEK